MARTKRSAKGAAQGQQVSVNIPGVSATTRLGDLTVRQFVDLVLQLDAQLPQRRPFTDAKGIDALLGQITKALDPTERAQGRDIDHVVQAAQGAILERMPDAMRRAIAAQGAVAARRKR
jgi:hypothetical protein